MLLCVAGGNTGFTRERSTGGARCSSQSLFVKNNANQQVMVEERCSMTSTTVNVSPDHVAAHETLFLDLRATHDPRAKSTNSNDHSVAYRSKVIVVRSDDSDFSATSEKVETCATTTTFKSNIVNGKRSTNTVLVRYKPSRSLSPPPEGNIKFEFSTKNDGLSVAPVSSSSSTISCESSSSKKDKASTSAWAQIMELEGYRSPAIGLDNALNKQSSRSSDDADNEVYSNFSSLSESSCRCQPSVVDGGISNCTAKFSDEDNYQRTSNSYCDHEYKLRDEKESGLKRRGLMQESFENDSSLSPPPSLSESIQINISDVIYRPKMHSSKDFETKTESINETHIVSLKPRLPVLYHCSDKKSKELPLRCPSDESSQVKMAQKVKSPMFRSESSRTPKTSSQERSKNRRKTLPDGTLYQNSEADTSRKRQSATKSQKSPEHDPNASWGRYNSRAMRDSVRKVAEKYAETVYLRRMSRSKLDALPEAKGIQLTKYVTPVNEQDNAVSRSLSVQKRLYPSRMAHSVSHLHEMPCETESVLGNHSKLYLLTPISTSHHHSSCYSPDAVLKYVSNERNSQCTDKLLKEKSEGSKRDLWNNRLVSDFESESSNSDKCSSKNSHFTYLLDPEKHCSCKGEGNYSERLNNGEENSVSKGCRRSQNSVSHTIAYQTPKPSEFLSTIDANEELKMCAGEAENIKAPSFHLQDIKSKLCAECALSAEAGPPIKHPASRNTHQHSDPQPFTNSKTSTQISSSKRSPLVIYEDDASLRQQLLSKAEDNAPKPDLNPNVKKFTMLTAREMADLVHGNGNTKNGDPKLTQTRVTTKVTNWIQRQKDKRKPVFFIGETPSLFTDSSKTVSSENNAKTSSRKSWRSLSLSSVREGEVSMNGKGIVESIANRSSIRLNPSANSDDSSLKNHEHKGLFIKRASSSCSNRGSARRKLRQGSPAPEEKELFTKNPSCGRNQVDGCVAPWNNRQHNKTKIDSHESFHSNNTMFSDANFESKKSPLVKNIYSSEISLPHKIGSGWTKNAKSYIQQDRLAKPGKIQNESFIEMFTKYDANEKIPGDNDGTSFKYQNIRHSQIIEPSHFRESEVADDVKTERSSFSKTFLNIKQLTRALSLHSLKKKTKENASQDPIVEKAALELVSDPHFNKWSRGSKRKIEINKYGSLRKSLSYCELTARGSKASESVDFSEHKSSAKPFIKTIRMPKLTSSCSCTSSLRRSVSLYWRFPLNRNLDYDTEEPKSDILAKLCFSRLYRRNVVPPFVRRLKHRGHSDRMKVCDNVKGPSDKHTKDNRFSSMDIRKEECSVKTPVAEHDGKPDLTRTASDTTSSEDQQKNLTSLDQIWRANPVKLCRVHSRLLMCRHKGRYRLRRSISQPVELEMTGSVHNLRESTHGSADHDSFQKGSLSSDDEASSESDIYHSYCCSPTRRSNTCWELSGDGTMYAEALWDHETLDSEELPFQAGDIIEVTDTSDQDWWWGTKDGHGGWFPSAFVRLYVSHRPPSLHFNGQQSDGIPIPYSPCKVSMNNLSCEQVRANIVQEIVATERDYVKHLKDVVEGYLKQVHRRPDMFSKERIETVFGNIKEIYNFQSQFLKQLEDCLDKDVTHLSQIGNCFLNHKEEFKMYSQYCNNHPLAVSELQELYCDSQYIHFFEACRLLQEMIDISLDGFLLTPIQRICKYPLQLAELLKFTDTNHPDHVPVSNALAAMKEVAELVNERKRRMECLERIAEWQNTIEGWEGPDVLDTSSILIHCGEVTRVSSSWSRDIYLFIFDHQLIYCKKDLLKRHTYAYKGRLNLDHCDIVDVEDGKDSQFAVNVKNAWKIYCRDKDKWYLFYAKTSPEKDQWLRAFKAERQRVIDDEKQAFVVTEEAKKSARLAVHNKQKPKRPRAKFTKGRRCHPDVAVTELLLDSPSAKARSGSLPSNIHPELAIMAGAKLGPTRKKGSGWFHFGSGKKPKS